MATTEKSPVKKGAGFDKGRVPGKTINIGTSASKTSPGTKTLAKLGSSKTVLPPGPAQTSTPARKSSLPQAKKPAIAATSPPPAAKQSKSADPTQNGGLAKGAQKGKASAAPSKGSDSPAGKKAASANGAAASGEVARLTTVPEQENARDATDDFSVPVVEYVKPSNQLQLGAPELEEDFARSLNAARPGPPRVILRYNLEEKAYKPEPQLEQVIVQYTSDGCLVWRDSEEGHRVVRAKAMVEELEARPAEPSTAESGKGAEAADPAKRLRNQFNFSERGAQTTYFQPRERETSTDTPETVEASGTCSHWEIFDAYVADQKMQRQQEDAQKQKAPGKGGQVEEEASLDIDTATPPDVVHSNGLRQALKILERMGVQNNYADVMLDFKYWEDEADEVRVDEGTLLPLWKFGTTLAGTKQVTAVSWSETYSDLFVVAFGSFDFQKQAAGLVAGFSLKNPAHPEFAFMLKSGAMCLQLHPQHSNLLAVGCYDGSVAVFDVRKKQSCAPLYSSIPKTGQHSRPVWAVEWEVEQPSVPLAFHSLSSDGRLLLWTLATAELNCQEVMRLSQASKKPQRPDEESSRPVLAAGCCFDFHPEQDFIFVVGTEEGIIHKCSTAHRSGYLLSYVGHDMAVYSVQWNKVDPTIFLSSSADWTVNLWHTDSPTAVMSFNLGSPVGDVAWSPSLATIFAAVTEDGLARMFDLQQNAAEPLCEQKVVAKAGLTRLSFSKKYPVLLIGDDRGQTTALKLSPNLRKHTAAESEAARLQAEKGKLEAVLAVARKSSEAVAEALSSR